MKKFLTITSIRFKCPGCNAILWLDLNKSIWAIVIVALIMAFPISNAIKNPIWWFGVLGAMVISFFVHYWFFSVKGKNEK